LLLDRRFTLRLLGLALVDHSKTVADLLIGRLECGPIRLYGGCRVSGVGCRESQMLSPTPDTLPPTPSLKAALAEDRALLVNEIVALYAQEPKLRDMRPSIVRGYLNPPQSPEECIFSKTTDCLSADLQKEITPCQFGGDPDCTQCGCLASVALDTVGRHRLGRVIPVRSILGGSLSIGRRVRRFRESRTVA